MSVDGYLLNGRFDGLTKGNYSAQKKTKVAKCTVCKGIKAGMRR